MTKETKNNQYSHPAEEQQSSDKTEIEYREISKEELKQILDNHKLWLESDEKEGKRADLEKTNLQELNLEGASLQKAILGEANLQNSEFRGANLQKAKFPNANLRKASFPEANLQKTYLFKANLEGTGLSGVNLKKANLSYAILKNAHLDKANFHKANLTGANLQNSYMHEAILQKSILANANLEKTDLSGANLQETDLSEANLYMADISKANMRSTNLSNVKGLSEANLQYTNLEGATGLLGNEFAQADVTGTKLPDDIKEFKALETVEKTSQNARKIFFAMLLGCVYSWLTIATTTDVRLLTNTASSPLPIIGTEIPIAWFYIAAPLVLVALYLYFHFYLQGLWESLAGLPAIFPDGKRLDERAYPWLLNKLVRRHFKRLKDDRPMMAKLQELVIISLAWWVIPVTLIGFWLRYLVRHELIGTSFHIFILLFTISFSLIFYQLCKTILQGDESETFNFKIFWNDRKSDYVILIGLILIFLSISVYENWGADFREKDVSIKPSDYYKIETVAKQIESVKGANLKGANLKNADMYKTFLVKADLRGANLQKVILLDADLRNANLAGANLQDAIIINAKLQNSNLVTAKLQNANLWNTDLQNANLQNANLSGAQLQNAQFRKSNLLNTKLTYANLTGANNLTIGQLSKVRSLYGAIFDTKLLEQVKRCCPNLLEKPK